MTILPIAYTVQPGATHVPGWLTSTEQTWIVAQFRRWAAGPVPARHPRVRGHEMSVQTVSLGWHWQPFKYTRTATDVNDAPVLPMEQWLIDLTRIALTAVGMTPADAATYTPDVAICNYYSDSAKLGMHQDKDEKCGAPVVSISIGDTCRFRFGNSTNRNRPYTDIDLASGDLFVFGGPARLAFHGVTKIHPNSAPDGCGLDVGRINITLRQTS